MPSPQYHSTQRRKRVDPKKHPLVKHKVLSTFAANLTSLARAFSADLVAASFGLSRETLSMLLAGVDETQQRRYIGHIAARLVAFGERPEQWLDHPIEADHKREMVLRKMAASAENKSAIRRANFEKLYIAIGRNQKLLATALDVVPDSVLGVINGELEFNTERSMHFAPRLALAGVSSEWLEGADSVVGPELVEAITTLAQMTEQAQTEDYESVKKESTMTDERGLPKSPAPSPRGEPVPQGAVAPEEQHAQNAELGLVGSPPPSAAGKTFTSAAYRRLLNKRLAPTTRRVLGAARDQGEAPGGDFALEPAKAPTTPDARVVARTNSLGAAVHERSARRRETLEQLFLISPVRGIRGILWQNRLKLRPGMWPAIRGEKRYFTDDLAQLVERALGLPAGWLENPQFPVDIARWFFQKEAADGAVIVLDQAGWAGEAIAIEPVERPVVAKPQARAPKASVARPAASGVQAVPAPVVVAPQVAPVAAPEPEPAAATAGPLATALLATLNTRVQSGTLTEELSLALLNRLFGSEA